MVLSWVAGNDMFLCVWLYETILVDGRATRQPFDFSTCDSVESSLVSKLGKKFVIPHEFHATDMNGLIMQIPCTIPPGKYSIDIKVVQDGYHLRSFEGGVVGIVVENAHAHTTFERISGAHHADYEIELGLIPLAEERPLNMYEEWKLQPGHEDMTFDDFMNDYAQQQVEVAVGDALDSKVDKVQGKGLSTNDFTDILKGKLDDMPNLKEVDSRELDGMISDSDEGFYVADGPGGPLLVEVYKDGATVYQWAIEPHSGHILVRTYNTQAISPAWSEFTDAYADKQDTLTFDSTPTAGSTNPVTSGGIKTALNGKQDKLYDGNIVKIVEVNRNATPVLKNEDNNEVTVIVGETDRYSGWNQGGDIRIPTIGLVKKKLTEGLATKQNTISDLATIRSGASAGATAVQPATLESGLTTKQDTLTFDSTPTADSSNPVTSAGIKAYVDSHSSGVTVDDALSTTSENPVQNKVVTAALDGKQATISDLSTIRSGAAAGATAVQPATLQSELAAKQDVLTFDNAPTANSNNPVKSDGVKTAIDAKQDAITTVNVAVDNNTGTPSGSASVSGSTLSLSFQNLKGATGVQGPQGIQGVQGPQGPKGDTGVTGDASSLAIIHGIDKTSSYGTTDVCGADAAQALLNEIEGGFYY